MCKGYLRWMEGVAVDFFQTILIWEILHFTHLSLRDICWLGLLLVLDAEVHSFGGDSRVRVVKIAKWLTSAFAWNFLRNVNSDSIQDWKDWDSILTIRIGLSQCCPMILSDTDNSNVNSSKLGLARGTVNRKLTNPPTPNKKLITDGQH